MEGALRLLVQTLAAFVKRMTRPLQEHYESAFLWEDAFMYFARFKIIFHFFAVWSELRSMIFWIQDGRWIPLLRSWVRLFQWFFELSSRGDRIVMSEILFDIYRHHCFFSFKPCCVADGSCNIHTHPKLHYVSYNRCALCLKLAWKAIMLRHNIYTF